MDSGTVDEGQQSFLMVLLIVLVTGARYLPPGKLRSLGSNIDLTRLQDMFMLKIEERLLLVFDENSVDSVAFLYLLCSHYLFNRRPSRAFIVFAASLRAAQGLGLYNETLWGRPTPVERETRRRLWWSVYVGDGFIAQTFGRPALVNETDIEVRQPLDFDDNLSTYHGFCSMERREDGTNKVVTIHSYMRLRSALYRIAAPIAQDMNFHRGPSVRGAVEQIKKIHQELVAWEQNIPSELRLGSFWRRKIDPEMEKVSHVFRLQAVALQISYDNTQLLLHRPLLSCIRRTDSGPHLSVQPDKDTQVHDLPQEPEIDVSIAETSKNQCWKSAMRTSRALEDPELWAAACSSPLGGHVGLHSFTAGVMLGVFALSSPLSKQSQEAKLGIARIIKMSGTPGQKAPIWTQSSKILEDLLRLILAEETKQEMKTLLSASEPLTILNSPSPSLDDMRRNHEIPPAGDPRAIVADHGRGASLLRMDDSSRQARALQVSVSGSREPVQQLELPFGDLYPYTSFEGDFAEAFSSLQHSMYSISIGRYYHSSKNECTERC
ncbi:uncharacterized protein A1O9_09765 [Exophiala aquamarina CBS 119918]|uniref:Xylanolytic transcriptional activator regulatory domain-containing protein n=1 Tax=Exophiala aquamarina CBS 119918 TaxID=1182545 RepID=A0A072PEI3_9EURO|nr:uncharacterized protein A1O9_09765 [Exophiala aquamarina CBS 119918]KEF53970.1 hypothetical protein A1O9_09765 [Exophiala aquamarina CBS 119918]